MRIEVEQGIDQDIELRAFVDRLGSALSQYPFANNCTFRVTGDGEGLLLEVFVSLRAAMTLPPTVTHSDSEFITQQFARDLISTLAVASPIPRRATVGGLVLPI